MDEIGTVFPPRDEWDIAAYDGVRSWKDIDLTHSTGLFLAQIIHQHIDGLDERTQGREPQPGRV